MTVLGKLKATTHKPAPKRPVWQGPEKDGVTFSLLSRFLCCRERFRVLVVEGLKPADSFNHRIEYGQLWHHAEEALAAGQPWESAIRNYVQDLCKRYPTSQAAIEHWYNVCRIQFPLYVEWWARHPDVIDRRPLLQEQVFNVPYTLPSGRTVRLRGKWDSVDLVGKEREASVWLMENKTKSDINEAQLKRQLTYDLQTMLYTAALLTPGPGESAAGRRVRGWTYGAEFAGVRYNVVRRPLSGGKGSIVQHKPTKSNPRGESSAAFYTRLATIIKSDPGYFFMRWKVEITPADIERFRRECLNPILENLCNWWESVRPNGVWTQVEQDAAAANQSWRHPFGIYNVLDEGGSSDLDEYLRSGSEIGLQRTDNLFPELS